MPKGVNWNKVSKLLQIKDGLGICRQCAFFDSTEFPNTINIGDDEYFDAICRHKVFPCYTVRSSLLACAYFKHPSKPKKESLISRLIRCFKTNDWSHLK